MTRDEILAGLTSIRNQAAHAIELLGAKPLTCQTTSEIRHRASVGRSKEILSHSRPPADSDSAKTQAISTSKRELASKSGVFDLENIWTISALFGLGMEIIGPDQWYALRTIRFRAFRGTRPARRSRPC